MPFFHQYSTHLYNTYQLNNFLYVLFYRINPDLRNLCICCWLFLLKFSPFHSYTDSSLVKFCNAFKSNLAYFLFNSWVLSSNVSIFVQYQLIRPRHQFLETYLQHQTESYLTTHSSTQLCCSCCPSNPPVFLPC